MDSQLPPPGGRPEQAESYINKIVTLVDDDKLTIFHTDLSKFDPSNLQDHYRLELLDYSVEISHSKEPDSGRDSYVMLFTNVKNIRENGGEKIILAYLHLDLIQFKQIVNAAHNQKERVKKRAEEARLKNALQPIDEALGALA